MSGSSDPAPSRAPESLQPSRRACLSILAPAAAACWSSRFVIPASGQDAPARPPEPSGGAAASGAYPAANGQFHPDFPSHDPAIVREVVGASHTRLDRVRELVEARPALAKATWDWGFGDWESALGAASHMGRRDIAEVLIAHGARPDLFTFAMLGNLAVVKAAIEAQPGIQRIPGPHGITLLQHARAGGAAEVVSYLESVGGADERATSLDVSESEQEVYLGRYEFDEGEDGVFVVTRNSRGLLAIQRGGQFSRVLNRVEAHGFAPGGAADVRIRFDVSNGRATSLTIHDPVPVVRAIRAG